MGWKRIAVSVLLGMLVAGLLAAAATAGPGCSKSCATSCSVGKKAEAPKAEMLKEQTTCPVMGGPIDKSLYVDVNGKRVYVCCQGCMDAVKADPDKYLARIGARGEMAADVPPMLCGKCGQIKGTEECCMKDAVKCKTCGMTKGSPGCCRLPEAGKDAELCTNCGEIRGSADCCDKDMQQCKKCGLAKDSPGCCRI
jgi:hypothetical protein